MVLESLDSDRPGDRHDDDGARRHVFVNLSTRPDGGEYIRHSFTLRQRARRAAVAGELFGAQQVVSDRRHVKRFERDDSEVERWVLPPLSVGEMTLRLYAALNYSQNSARDLRRALNGA